MKKNGLDYALKAFLPGDPGSRSHLEADILSRLDHPGIPRFIESFTHDDIEYMVQEFINGYPLSYYIVNGKRFEEDEVLKIASGLLETLTYLHEPCGNRYPVIHRDLRLSNIFWSENKVHVIDFGMARYLTEKVDSSGTPPEGKAVEIHGRRPGKRTYARLRGEVSPFSDMFGAGVVILDLFANWIADDKDFKKPWQEIFPGSVRLKSFIERLLLPEIQFTSVREASDWLKKT